MAKQSRWDVLDGLLRLSVRHPRSVIGVVLALTVAAALAIPGVRVRLDGRSLIPQDYHAQVESERAAKLFDLRDVIVVGIESPQGIYNPRTLALVAELSDSLARVEGIVPGSVASLATLPRFSVDANVLDPLPLLARQGPVSAEVAARVRQETREMGLEDGVLVARDGKTTAIYAEVRAEADRYRVLQEVRALVGTPARVPGPDRVRLSGTALAQAVLGLSAARDLTRLLPAVLLTVALALTLLFRHPAPALVSLGEIGVSLVWTAGIMGVLGESIFVTTLVLPVILVVIGVSDDVYALNGCFRALRASPGVPVEETVVESFRAVKRPILLTSATTIAGLLSLALTNLEPQRVFGVYGALAILFSSLFTFSFVPAMLVLRRLRVAAREEPAASGERLRLLCRTLEQVGPRRGLAVLLLLVGLAVWATTRLRIEDNWVDNLPPSGDIARDTHRLDRELAGTLRIEVLVDSGKRDGFLDPAAFRRLGQIESALTALPGVGAAHSVYGDVVRVQSALDGVDQAAWRADLESGRRALGSSDVEQALLILSSLRRSPLSERIDGDYRRARITVFVRDAEYSLIAGIVRAAAELSTNGMRLTPFGDGWINYLAVRLLVTGQIQSVGFALLANTVLLLLLFRRFGDALLTLAPILVSVLLVFAALALSGAPLGIANSMFTAIALGIGVDYSIHLVAHYRERRTAGEPLPAAIGHAIELTGPAILKSAVAIAAGLSVLAFSEVRPNLQLGLLVSLSLTVCAAMTLLLVPGLVLARAERRADVPDVPCVTETSTEAT